MSARRSRRGRRRGRCRSCCLGAGPRSCAPIVTGVERAAAREQRLAAAPRVRLLGGALRLRRRIRQREDDRRRLRPRHRLDHGLREPAGCRPPRRSGGRLEFANRGDEIGLRRVLVGVRHCARRARSRPLTTRPLESKSQQERRACAGSAPSRPARRPQVGNAGGRFAGPRKSTLLAIERGAGDAQRRVQARPAPPRRALDVIVEACRCGRGILQQAECVVVGEVLELDDDTGKDLARGVDEFLDQFVVGRAGQPRLRAGRGRAGRRATSRCWCRRRASPAGTAPGCTPAHAV